MVVHTGSVAAVGRDQPLSVAGSAVGGQMERWIQGRLKTLGERWPHSLGLKAEELNWMVAGCCLVLALQASVGCAQSLRPPPSSAQQGCQGRAGQCPESLQPQDMQLTVCLMEEAGDAR